ncbi:MAG: hypothetical protein D5R97_04100 [Candidatus Syntrophonatronum acetioxidans]|uniref:DUF2229 domain-containing protein n=1 Tax=Candidatus Syntrophonatronum acetioxidans TaxID=1795816 RepID=A0A424YFL5_9FIRM|nr:MAG: hypothetical protein D5R97_04100 [Candidatus Syntrophonatronum acetioxidans]
MPAVGIPRALLYYDYFPAWKKFFEELGVEVVLSDKTNKTILDSGVKLALDETCLPVKLIYGHVDNLKNKNVDYLFIPRLVSVERKKYLCPKFLGLPNMVQNLMADLPPLLDFKVDLSRKKKEFYKDLYKLGRKFHSNPLKVFLAYRRAIKELKSYQEKMLSGFTPGECLEGLEKKREEGKGASSSLVEKNTPGERKLRIAVLGHSYNLNDSYISMDLYGKLRKMGVNIITREMISPKAQQEGVQNLRKDIFWTFGKEIMGSALYLLKKEKIDGVVLVVSFGCGPDSLIGELVERIYKRQKDVPLLFLTLDEHSGEAGILTRLEAFVDMVKFKKESA